MTTTNFSPELRIVTVVQSCQTIPQLQVATRYARLMINRQPVEKRIPLNLILFKALIGPNLKLRRTQNEE